MDYFTNSVFNMSDKNTLTPPMDYRLGVGDEIVVNIYGQSETQQNYTIGRDGSISPRYIGKIYLQGMTFENAKNVIQNKFRSIVAASTIDVQLGKIRTIKVTIIGEVNRNGTSTFSAFTTAISAIANAGGITKLGNLRNIEIKRNGRIVNTIDLYEFIRNGGSLEDQYLEDGDIINVGTYEKLVKAEGSFKRPMYYQLKENENLNNLIDLAGGPAFDARFSSVQIKSIIGEQPRILTVNLKDVNNKNETHSRNNFLRAS
jgi:protein involved in polysaccharide export with SLBB domain